MTYHQVLPDLLCEYSFPNFDSDTGLDFGTQLILDLHPLEAGKEHKSTCYLSYLCSEAWRRACWLEHIIGIDPFIPLQCSKHKAVTT
jgi:hypothetical protein